MSGLPVVHPGVAAPLERELCDKFDGPFLKEEIKRLRIKNPVIAEFIEKFSKKTEDREGVMFCSIIVYKLLENQAEADELNNLFQ